jgi:hypothetical protein
MKAKTIIQLMLVVMLAIPLVLAIPTKDFTHQQNKDKGQEDLHPLVPQTYEEAKANIIAYNGKYILWTIDGSHIMWGEFGYQTSKCGNSECDPTKSYCLMKCSGEGYGYFIGQDDLGNEAWGVFNKRNFAGIYNGEPFSGNWNEKKWTASGLFGLDKASGSYVTFKPTPVPVAPPYKPLPPGMPIIE